MHKMSRLSTVHMAVISPVMKAHYFYKLNVCLLHVEKKNSLLTLIRFILN